MNTDWGLVLSQLRAYGSVVNEIGPPCPRERLEVVQRDLGKMPGVLVDMLSHFSCAELFIKSGPLISIFGITTITPLPPFKWAQDWYIDKFTPAWRSAKKRPTDWAIAMWNYGGLVVLDQDGWTKEWDTSENSWGPRNLPLDEWIQVVLKEGDAFLKEE